MKRFASVDRTRGPLEQGVPGERGVPVIARALSVQAKVSNLLAMGLMVAIGSGLLLWYYTHQLTRQARARQSAQASAVRQAGTEMALPTLGPIELPVGTGSQPAPVERADPIPPSSLTMTPTLAPTPVPLTMAMTGPGGDETHRRTLAETPSAATPAPRPTAVERRLSGEVFAAVSAAPATGAGPLPLPSAVAVTAPGELSSLLRADAARAVSAYVLPGRSLLLPKGSFIDCTLETAIDSTLPGMTTCVTATDTFGADGSVVLLERGTKLVGETRGQVQQGAARVFVLWSEARTPGGVVVPLDSPGTDELGRSGLPGTVQRHFWERFGAAILVSTVDGAVQAAVQSSARDNGTVIYNPGASEDVMTEVLKSTVAIPPTVIKRNGDRIQVLVARDVDFGDVYELRHVGLDQ